MVKQTQRTTNCQLRGSQK